MARYNIGDIYVVNLSGGKKKYFQHIANDIEQLDSNVIKAFKSEYNAEDNPLLEELAMDEVDFYIHIILKIGLKLKRWEKVGKAKVVGSCDIFFKSTNDYGNPEIKVSKDWWVWKLNGEKKYVGKLTGKYKEAEIGVVVNPDDVLERMETGKFSFFYPSF